tara:strand:- start:289 stop:990 length:702 start_codon:yes stop_codon:yes gene_type:complete
MFAVAMQKYYPCGKIIQAAMSSYPIEWLQCYVKKNYILIDPVIKQTLLSSLPFKWADLDYRSRRAQALIKDARALGITNGITVPMYTQDGEKFLYSLAGGDSINLAGERLDQIYSTVYLALCGSSNALRHLFLSRNEVPPVVSLTKAQCEVLQMLMQGNTAKQVARTLGIHIRAVEDRIARACERLKANSRTQALVRALSTGQISLLSPQSQKMSTQDWYVHVPKKTETERSS